jgi:hypothetical protein
MRRNAFLAPAIFLLTLACSSSGSRSDTPPVSLQLGLVNAPANILFFPGSVNLQFALAVQNPTDETLTLRRLDLRTIGSGSFFMRTSGTPFNVQIKPHATTTVTLSAWGNSRGGYLAQDEPIDMQVTAYFDSAKGPFVKLSQQMLSPGG